MTPKGSCWCAAVCDFYTPCVLFVHAVYSVHCMFCFTHCVLFLSSECSVCALCVSVLFHTLCALFVHSVCSISHSVCSVCARCVFCLYNVCVLLHILCVLFVNAVCSVCTLSVFYFALCVFCLYTMCVLFVQCVCSVSQTWQWRETCWQNRCFPSYDDTAGTNMALIFRQDSPSPHPLPHPSHP